MTQAQYSNRTKYFIGPNGDVVTRADLPTAHTKRWIMRRKAEVVAAVRGGMLSLDEACNRYRLTVEEYSAWESAMERYGMPGLSAACLQTQRHRKATARPRSSNQPLD